MATLTEFLLANPVDNVTEEVKINSARLANYKFKIKAMTGPEFSQYQKAATVIGGKAKVKFDSGLFNELVVINHTLEPNFKDAETIKKAGCTTPEQFLYKVLLSGEVIDLGQKISALSGFESDFDETVDKAKNS